jgi:hypothetical protein
LALLFFLALTRVSVKPYVLFVWLVKIVLNVRWQKKSEFFFDKNLDVSIYGSCSNRLAGNGWQIGDGATCSTNVE